MTHTFPLGKLPPQFLAGLLNRLPTQDPRVRLGPGLGLDCAVIDAGPSLWVVKTDPITFASQEIGWYLVQVNANDIATTGATPRWLMMTLLLPEKGTTAEQVEAIADQVAAACRAIGVVVIGGHTEVTSGLDRPIAVGTLIGEVAHDQLITPRGAEPGDVLLLTKGVPIEATAILAREMPERLTGALSSTEIAAAAQFLYQPGISVLRDAQIAVAAGGVTAMHDPTEGGLASALWELADASGNGLEVDPRAIPIPPLSAKVCQALGLNPLAAIASGALLLAARSSSVEAIQAAWQAEGIACAVIGRVTDGPAEVRQRDGSLWLRPERDEIARIFAGD